MRCSDRWLMAGFRRMAVGGKAEQTIAPPGGRLCVARGFEPLVQMLLMVSRPEGGRRSLKHIFCNELNFMQPQQLQKLRLIILPLVMFLLPR